MVDVAHKAETLREAEAECRVTMSGALLRLLRAGALAKGDARAAAELAGVLAAKRTASLLPLAHPLPLASVRVSVTLEGGGARVRCVARARARTGVEMEALTGCAVAALTLYDMGKAADRHIAVEGLRVLRKVGGRHDFDLTADTGRSDTDRSDTDRSDTDRPETDRNDTNKL